MLTRLRNCGFRQGQGLSQEARAVSAIVGRGPLGEKGILGGLLRSISKAEGIVASPLENPL